MGSTPLKQISKSIDICWEDPVVPRYNGQRSQRVQCSPAPGIETEKARQAIARKIEQIELPDGYTLHWQGEREECKRPVYEVPVQELPAGHHINDCHPHYVVQGLS